MIMRSIHIERMMIMITSSVGYASEINGTTSCHAQILDHAVVMESIEGGDKFTCHHQQQYYLNRIVVGGCNI